MVDAGDPYPRECAATTRALRERLGLDDAHAVATFQSVFGPAQWMTPATIDTVEALARHGVRRVDVVCPGFVSDCLETLEEIAILSRETFHGAGGAQFHHIPWGNGDPVWTDALTQIVDTHLAGWA